LGKNWDLLTKRQKKEFHHMHLRKKKTFDKKTKKEVSSHAFTKKKTFCGSSFTEQNRKTQ
jgi:hypothetical protein